MKAYQLTIPAKNQPGVLAKVTSILAREKINIRATTISSFGEHGFFNLIVDDVERAERVLKKGGIEVQRKEVIAVLMKDQPGGLDRLVQVLAAAGVNIENAYGFVIESRIDAVFVLDVKNPAEVKELLKKEKFATLSAEALCEIEPFHYMKY
ncbi:MAG: ACT domain-containing protein [Deltaproteobacteria bacterium]|nr:ACT domain-containing protein [Deltaproteobacteria bacterium]